MLFGFLKKKAYPDIERRKEPRFPADDEFIVRFKMKQEVQGYSRDFSVHGVRFASSVKLKKGTHLELEYYFPKEFNGPTKIRVKGVVLRSYQPSKSARFRAACKIYHESDLTREIFKQFAAWLKAQA